MKFLSVLVLLLSLSTTATAQTALDEQIALVRQSAHTDRKLILMGNMTFTVEESEAFWPVWNEYRAAVAANGDRRLAAIKDFAANFEQMTDQKAQELMTDHFSIQMQNLVVKQNFSKELTKIMPAKKAMRVMQSENTLDAAIDLQLASEIPLAK